MSATSAVPASDGRADGRPAVVLAASGPDAERRLISILRNAGIELSDGEPPEAAVVACAGPMLARTAAVRAAARAAEGRPVVAVLPRDSRGVRSALEAGADGVVLEDEAAVTLVPTIEAVLAGQLVVPRSGRYQTDRPTLSRREKEVLSLVVRGLSNGQIAARLYLAESTVKCHLSSAFGKLGVHSRNEAVKVILDPAEQLGLAALAVGDGYEGAQGSRLPAR